MNLVLKSFAIILNPVDDLVNMVDLWLKLAWPFVEFKFLLSYTLNLVPRVVQLVLQALLLMLELFDLPFPFFILVDLPCDLLPDLSHLCLYMIFLLIETHIVVPHLIVPVLVISCLLFKLVQFLLQLICLDTD